MLKEVKLTTFRCFQDFSIEIPEFFSFLHGSNGCGKTSIIEAIYFLAYGRSFRASSYKKLINFEANSFVITAKIQKNNDLSPKFVGIEKDRTGASSLFVNFNKSNNFSDIAQNLPVLLLNNQSYLLLDGEPLYRRKFLDWMLFHVEPNFFFTWQRFKKVLSQRNALIKSLDEKPSLLSTLDYWDQKYEAEALAIDDMRCKIVLQYEIILKEILQNIYSLRSFKVNIRYKKGWKQGETLNDCLFCAKGQDLAFKTTTQGPHRADLVITVNNKLAKFVLSRGQIKLLVFALDLARARLLENVLQERKSLFLIDDVYSELDNKASDIVMDEIKNHKFQTLFTGINPPVASHIEMLNLDMFHVEREIIT